MILNYKKSLLSLAAVAALSISALHADYIPLTDSAGNDEQWTLFGVTGIKTDGAGAGTTAGTFSISDTTANKVEDTTLDELFVAGAQASTGENLAKVKVLSPYSQVEVRVDTTGAVYNATEPVRTMYVKMTDGGGAAFAFTYRASLEGKTMQYSTNSDGSDAHTITISSNYTYSNPGLGEVIQEIAGIAGAGLDKITEMVDYDLSNNPSNYSYYDKATDQNIAGAGEYLRIYSFDAVTETWKLYDSRNSDAANDFDALLPGKAYWAKMNNGATLGGLVLGSSSISTSDYAAAEIADGWNLMAFDKENPYIRKSSTGLIVTLNATNTPNGIKIWDASGNHFVTADVDGTSMTTANASCKSINNAIKQAKIDGKFPDTFDLKAFASSATQIVLVSTKRFIIDELVADSIGGVTTLTGANPYTVDPTDLITTDDTVAMADLDNADATKAAMSKYGEYALFIEPLVGDVGGAPWDTAAAIVADSAKVHIQSAAADATAATPLSIDEQAGTAAAITQTVADINLKDIGGVTPKAVEIDKNYDDITELILIAATKPFYVRDYTFTRTFTFTDDAGNENDITINGTGTNGTYTTVVGDIDAQTLAVNLNGTFGVTATEDSTNSSIVVISSATDANEFTLTENTSPTVLVDQLKDSVVAEDIAKGAIKGVYSIDGFATQDTVNTLSFTVLAADIPDALTDVVTVDLKNTIGQTILAAAVHTSAVAGPTAAVWAAEFQSVLESALSSAKITSTVTAVVNGANVDVTITASDIKDIAYTWVGGETALAFGAATADFGTLATTSPDLVADLKFNAVYTPNYVVDGPLYTMKENAKTLKALVTGTTDISDGSVNWDSIDLTRTPSAWLDSQDYNLFQVSQNAGYWAFLEADTGSNAIAISNAALNPATYTYHFNLVNIGTGVGSNDSHFSGNIALTIDGLDTDTRAIPVVSATVGGSNIELSNTAGSNVYSGKISSYEAQNIATGDNYEILANIADGLGYNKKSLTTGLTIDLLKPATPDINLGDGTSLALTSTSADVAGYYIYDGQIPEEGTATATNLLATLTAAEAAAYPLCASVTKKAWNGALYNLNVIAVDGSGKLGGGNISDTATKKFVPMLQDAVRLIDDTNNDDANITVATTLGEIFDASCASSGAQTINYGVSLTAESDLSTVKLAYEPQNIPNNNAVIITIWVKATVNGVDYLARIDYADVYADKDVYIELGGAAVYSFNLPKQTEIDGATYGGANQGDDDQNPIDLGAGAGLYAEIQADQAL